MGRLTIFDVCLVILGIALFPVDALAWGPVAHLDFALQILAGAAVVAPVARRLIQNHTADFLYGSLAADAIVGKNLARHHDHCHNWDVARDLYRSARRQGKPRETFALGYIGHLGADVMAHNHIVPRMLLVHFRAKGVGHIYWEMRADEKLVAMNPKLAPALKNLTARRRFREHDKFLAEHLRAPLLSHTLSKEIFRRSANLQGRSPWRRAFGRIERRSKLLFTNQEMMHWRDLAVRAACLAINDPMGKRLDSLDPRGRTLLAKALRHRKALRRELRKNGHRGRLDEMLGRALVEIPEPDLDIFGES
jgi:hypothetical protein